jgi:hypothetical protein
MWQLLAFFNEREGGGSRWIECDVTNVALYLKMGQRVRFVQVGQ